MVIFGHVIGLVIPESWTSAVGLSQHGYHIQAVALGSIAGIATLMGAGILVYRRRTKGPVFMATTWNDKLMYVVLILAIIAGLATTLIGSGLIGEEHNYRETVSVWFRSIFILQPDGEAMAQAPLSFQIHALIGHGAVRAVAVHPAGARVQRADRLPVPAVHRLPQPRRRGQGPSGGVDAAAPGLVTTSSLRRESAVGDASSEADSYGQCNFRGFGGCHAEWISALEVGAAGVVRPGAWGPAEAGGAESPRFGYTAFVIDAYAGLIPG